MVNGCFTHGGLLPVGLANPKAVVGHFTAYDHKEVLSPLQVTEFNNSGNAPHYYSSTGNLQVNQHAN